jgi:preprotein translocase subunit SecD
MVKRYLTLVSVLLAFQACSKSDHATLAFRLAEDRPAPGLTKMAFEPTGESFYLHDEVLLNESDVDSASAVHSEGRWNVDLVLTPEGTRKFAELTANNVGSRCGMILNGRLVSVPRIMAPIMMGRAVIVSDFTEQEARRFARALTRS